MARQQHQRQRQHRLCIALISTRIAQRYRRLKAKKTKQWRNGGSENAAAAARQHRVSGKWRSSAWRRREKKNSGLVSGSAKMKATRTAA